MAPKLGGDPNRDGQEQFAGSLERRYLPGPQGLAFQQIRPKGRLPAAELVNWPPRPGPRMPGQPAFFVPGRRPPLHGLKPSDEQL